MKKIFFTLFILLFTINLFAQNAKRMPLFKNDCGYKYQNFISNELYHYLKNINWNGTKLSGTCIYTVEIDNKSKINSVSILQSIHPKLDTEIINFVSVLRLNHCGDNQSYESRSSITYYNNQISFKEKIEPKLNVPTKFLDILLLIDENKFDEAHAIIDSLLKKDSENINHTYLKAFAFYSEKLNKEACIIFQLALKQGYSKGFSAIATQENIEKYLLETCQSE